VHLPLIRFFGTAVHSRGSILFFLPHFIFCLHCNEMRAFLVFGGKNCQRASRNAPEHACIIKKYLKKLKKFRINY